MEAKGLRGVSIPPVERPHARIIGRRFRGKGGDSYEGGLGRPFGGFLLLPAYLAIHLTGELGLPGP
jgi:hypothetical protein